MSRIITKDSASTMSFFLDRSEAMESPACDGGEDNAHQHELVQLYSCRSLKSELIGCATDAPARLPCGNRDDLRLVSRSSETWSDKPLGCSNNHSRPPSVPLSTDNLAAIMHSEIQVRATPLYAKALTKMTSYQNSPKILQVTSERERCHLGQSLPKKKEVVRCFGLIPFARLVRAMRNGTPGAIHSNTVGAILS
jgi:hypothetical protein